MPGGGGLDALTKIRKQAPGLPVLIVSMHPEEEYALRAFKAGASGYLNKTTASEELVKAVKRVLAGKKYIPIGLANHLAEKVKKTFRWSVA